MRSFTPRCAEPTTETPTFTPRRKRPRREDRRAERRSGWQLVCILRAITLLTVASRASAAKQTMLPDRRESTIEIKPALNYIRWNYAEHIYVDMLCELCHMSPANFRRKFKEAMGVTPLDYIHEVRIEKA